MSTASWTPKLAQPHDPDSWTQVQSKMRHCTQCSRPRHQMDLSLNHWIVFGTTIGIAVVSVLIHFEGLQALTAFAERRLMTARLRIAALFVGLLLLHIAEIWLFGSRILFLAQESRIGFDRWPRARSHHRLCLLFSCRVHDSRFRRHDSCRPHSLSDGTGSLARACIDYLVGFVHVHRNASLLGQGLKTSTATLRYDQGMTDCPVGIGIFRLSYVSA